MPKAGEPTVKATTREDLLRAVRSRHKRPTLSIDDFLAADEWRWQARAESSTGKHRFSKRDLSRCLEYKMTLGQYRPSLPKLINSNPERTVEDTVRRALEAKGDKEALKILVELRGVGVATASLILSLYRPATIAFMSDEAIYEALYQGRKESITYNEKTYERLLEHLRAMNFEKKSLSMRERHLWERYWARQLSAGPQ